MNLKTVIKMSPEVITRPRWFYKWAKTMRPPALSAPNQGAKGEAGPSFLQTYGEWMGTAPPPGTTSAGCAACGKGRSCPRA
jgi:L-lactate dehydrogenase (cytochrome)